MNRDDALFAHIRGLDAKLDAQFEGLRALMQVMNDRVASIDERLNIQNGKVHKTIEDLGTTRTTLAVVERSVKDLDQKVSTASKRVVTVASGATALVATAANQAWSHREWLRGVLNAAGVPI